jgi:hypothetical protein
MMLASDRMVEEAFAKVGIRSQEPPTKPAGIVAPGLGWRPRKNGWAAVWIATKKGFEPETHQIGIYTSAPTEQEWDHIAKECQRLDREVNVWEGTNRPNSGRITEAAPPPKIEIATLPPLTLGDWRNRDLAAPDLIMGHWLTTTSRILLAAATGIGKTKLGLGLGMRTAASEDFLHWRAHRPTRVLYIDGEMSRRLLRQRMLDEEKRIGITPETFFALSREDVEGMKPLNTIEGQAWMDALIKKIGGLDLIILDNIMSLLVGDMKDPKPWQETLPWALSLTKREIGQVWIHHAGIDESRSYGDKTKEWQMDTTMHLDAVKRDDTDVSFSLSFIKARERTPTTRFDFQDVKIALVNDQWEHELTDTRRPGKVSPQTQKALDALINVLAGDQVEMLPGGRRAAHRDYWAIECNARGLIDAKRNEKSATTMFNRFRRELVAANLIACEGDLQWLLR